MIICGQIDISSLLRAQATFERFRVDMHNDRDEAGAIQAFEFCFELCWKTIKRVLALRGVFVGSPREVFRAAFADNLISNVETWFVFLKMRNESSHVYDEEKRHDIVAILPAFSIAQQELIITLMSLQ